MRHSRCWRQVVLSTLCLAALLGLALTTTSCRHLGSGEVQTTIAVPGTETTAATGSELGRISADNILFRDDFQDGDAEGWQVNGAWTTQQDGDLYTLDATGKGYASVPKGVSWAGDYAFKVLYQLTAGTLVFSFDATQNGRYYVSVTPELISLVKDDASDNRTVLTQAQAPATGARHYLAIAKRSGIIQVYLDKALWLAYEDASPFTVGTIVVGATEGTTGWVDDVFVHKILRALPQKTPAVAAVAATPSAVQDVAPPDENSLAALPEPAANVPDLPAANVVEEIEVPQVRFEARLEADAEAEAVEELTVPPGSRVMLFWYVENATAVFLNGDPQPMSGTMSVLVQQDYNYQLQAIGLDGEPYPHYVKVTVSGQPEPLAEGIDLSVFCTVTVTEGKTVAIHVEVINRGDLKAEGALFAWYGVETSGVMDKQATVTIGAGKKWTKDYTFTYASAGAKEWVASISTQPLDADLDRDNNSARGTVTISQ